MKFPLDHAVAVRWYNNAITQALLLLAPTILFIEIFRPYKVGAAQRSSENLLICSKWVSEIVSIQDKSSPKRVSRKIKKWLPK